MAFEDDFGCEPYEDDLQSFSDQEAWEDSQADLAETRENEARHELAALARKALHLQLELAVTLAQMGPRLPEGTEVDLPKHVEFTCLGLEGPEGLTDEVVATFLDLIQEEP